MKPITEAMIEIALKEGWSKEHAQKGYVVSESDYMGGALHIERIDCMCVFDGDFEAAEQAEKDGIKIIKDLPECVDIEDMAIYIDTTENREIIRSYLKEKYIDFKPLL